MLIRDYPPIISIAHQNQDKLKLSVDLNHELRHELRNRRAVMRLLKELIWEQIEARKTKDKVS